jgi:hypothetical protein
MRTNRWLLALVLTGLIGASCGNSGDDTAADETTADDTPTDDTPTAESAPATSDASEDAAPSDTSTDERDTVVAISGVPGVSDDEISFAVIGTKANNPLGTCILDCYVDGIRAYFDFRNSEGGIYGRDLVLGEVLDDELGQNQVRAIDVISSEEAFGVFDASLLASGFADLDAAGVPTFIWNIHATEKAGRTGIFGSISAICGDCTQRAVPYLVGESGATRVAALGYGVSENSKVCASSLKESIELYADDIGGAEVVYFNDDLGFGLPNGIAPEVTAMKDAGVEFVTSCLDLNGMKTLGEELQRQEMDDVVMVHPNTYNQEFVMAAGDIFEGDFVTAQFLPFEADTGNELQATFMEFMTAQGKEPTELAMVGFINADEAFSALLAAGPDFDRQSAIDSFNKVSDYTAGGLIVPIDWTGTGHQPLVKGEPGPPGARQCAAPVQVVNGQFETVANPVTPFLCWDNSTLDWTEVESVAFEDR